MTRVLVVGTGIAGLTTALTLAPSAQVTVITKATATRSNTHRAQGGIAAVTSADDDVAHHVADTLTAGAGWSDRAAVEVLCGEGPARIADLIEAGVAFDRDDTGTLARGLEAAHSRARVLHAGGDATGAAIATGLLAAAGRASIEVRERVLVTDLLLEGGRVVGAELLDLTTGTRESHRCDAVVLATGGAGQLYPYTSNPEVATGDGVALAARAGAGLADLELYQFHPTTLALPGNFLVSEAVRGEGAVLRDAAGDRFMPGVHPDAELAPRDVVARAVAAQLLATGAPVYLDATALGEEFLRRRFPSIDAAIRAAGLDWSREPVPITPAAHYWMGGVATDLWGRSTLPGLLAVGEVACTGVHGGNRLASNSLLEGAVFGHRAARALLGDPAAEQAPARPQRTDLVYAERLPEAPAGAPGFSRAALQQLLWSHAGLVRDETGLARAEKVLTGWAVAAPVASGVATTHAAAPTAGGAVDSVPVDGTRDVLAAHEDANLLLLARLLAHAARRRTESLGAHFRTDASLLSDDVPAADSAPAVDGAPVPAGAPRPDIVSRSPELVLETH